MLSVRVIPNTAPRAGTSVRHLAVGGGPLLFVVIEPPVSSRIEPVLARGGNPVVDVIALHRLLSPLSRYSGCT